MTDIPPEFNPETAPPRLTIDWDAYLPFFEDEDISDEHKRELIEPFGPSWSVLSILGSAFTPSNRPVDKKCLWQKCPLWMC